MLRSVIAVTAGVLIGVAIVIYASFIVSAMLPSEFDPGKAADMTALPVVNQAGIVAVWFVGVFLAALAATLISGKWAPVSWIVAATMALFAMSNYSSFPAPAWMQLATYAAIVGAGWAPVRLTNASYARPTLTRGGGL